jgi:hypothetical protein
VNKSRREVKKLKYKLDEYAQKDPFILSNSSSSSSSSLLSKDELPQIGLNNKYGNILLIKSAMIDHHY